KRIGVSRVTYIAWEKDDWLPGTEHFKRIIEIFRPNENDQATLYRLTAQQPPEIFHVPPLLSRFLPGGKGYWQLLRKLLQESDIVAISGLGGMGKSQIALKYANDSYPDDCRTVLWVNAADKSILETEYASLAQILGLPEKDDQDIKQRIEAVKYWLQTHTS